jgi:hypothetical protein
MGGTGLALGCKALVAGLATQVPRIILEMLYGLRHEFSVGQVAERIWNGTLVGGGRIALMAAAILGLLAFLNAVRIAAVGETNAGEWSTIGDSLAAILVVGAFTIASLSSPSFMIVVLPFCVPLVFVYPRDEHCQCAVGSAADPWRTSQARHRYWTNERRQVHGQATRPAVPRLEDVPPQSCRRDRRDGYVRRADNLISSALRLVDCGAWSTADFMAWRHSASNRRMDRKSGHGSLRLGTSSPLSHS